MSRLFVVFVGESETILDQLVLSLSGQIQKDCELLIEKTVGDFTHVSVSPPSSPRSLSPTRGVLPLQDSSPMEQDKRPASIFVVPAEHALISIKLDSTAASAFCHLMCTSEGYCKQLQRHWTIQGNDSLLHVSVIPCVRQYLDYIGNHMAKKLIVQFVEMDDALNWLSTLGGAYSNLGEHNQAFAKHAEMNAKKQLKVAMKAGDLFSVIKCWLFIAMSQMQQGHLLRSRKILRNVYKFCGSQKIARVSGSSKLRTMCRGIWSRLKHSWDQTYQTIEVETKFEVADDYANALNILGGRLSKKVKLVDIYYDTESFDLMRKDHWFRLRNDVWELKSPVEGEGHCTGLTAYREYSDPKVIVDTVSRLIPQLTQDNMDAVAQDNIDTAQDNMDAVAQDNMDTAQDNMDTAQDNMDTAQDNMDTAQDNMDAAQDNMDAVAQDNMDTAEDSIQQLVSRLTVLAELTTYRECWKVSDVQVVVDTVKHEEQVLTLVGEVEMVVGATNQMDLAREKVRAVAEALGVTNNQPKGKLEVYLRKMKPDAAVILDALKEAINQRESVTS